MKNELVRKYHVTDAEMLAAAGSFSAMYETREPHFFAYNSVKFNPAFLISFKGAIGDALGFGIHSDVQHHMAAETQDVGTARTKAVKCFGILCNIAEDAFPEPGRGKQIFATSSRKKLKRWPIEKVIIFLESVENSITEFEAVLTAAGYTPKYRSDFSSSLAALLAAKSLHGETVRLIPTKTRSRVELLNNVWDFMVAISAAAEFVYSDNEEVAGIFELPRPHISAKAEDETPKPPSTPKSAG